MRVKLILTGYHFLMLVALWIVNDKSLEYIYGHILNDVLDGE